MLIGDNGMEAWADLHKPQGLTFREWLSAWRPKLGLHTSHLCLRPSLPLRTRGLVARYRNSHLHVL